MTRFGYKPNDFRQGTPVDKVLSGRYQSNIQEQLNRTSNIIAGPGIYVQNTPQGIIIGLTQQPQWLFGKIGDDGVQGPDGQSRVDNELHPYEDAVFVIEGYKPADAGPDHIDALNSETIYVVDVFGVSSQQGTKGIAIDHPNSKLKRWVFLPAPVAGGEATNNYDGTKHQAFTHTGQGVPKWVDIDDCE